MSSMFGKARRQTLHPIGRQATIDCALPEPMLGFSATLPISEEDRRWVDDSFRRLEKLLGRPRMVEAKVILPTAEDFPDPYDATPSAAERLFRRVCGIMQVDHRQIEFEIFADETQDLRGMLPYWRSTSDRSAAGLYVHGVGHHGAEEHDAEEHDKGEHKDENDQDRDREQKCLVAIKGTQLKDPLTLVATMAHELGHVILLGGRLIDGNSPDHEPLTDLLTVFLGFGIFTANSARRFKQYQDDRRQGWSMMHLGYLSEEIYGYALARFAWEREEDKPEWTTHLSTNVRAYYRRSRAWLIRNVPRQPTAQPID